MAQIDSTLEAYIDWYLSHYDDANSEVSAAQIFEPKFASVNITLYKEDIHVTSEDPNMPDGYW